MIPETSFDFKQTEKSENSPFWNKIMEISLWIMCISHEHGIIGLFL